MNAARPTRGRVKAVLGAALGLGLLAAAVVAALRGTEVSVLETVRPGGLGAMAALVVANLALTATLFWAVTRSFAARPPVGWGRTAALLAVSGVLNYVPVVRAGLWGRAAYLKRCHGLPLRESVLILGVVLALAGVVLGGVAAALLVLPGPWGWGGAAAVLAAATGLTSAVARRVLRRPVARGWLWVPVRTLDLAAAAGRLGLAFAAVGQALTPADAVLLASGSLVVKLSGLTPNGLGLSEWVVAALAAALTPIEAGVAAAAALVDRTVEVGAALGAGGWGAWHLARAGRSERSEQLTVHSEQ